MASGDWMVVGKRRAYLIGAAWALAAVLLWTALPTILGNFKLKPYDGIVDWTVAKAWWAGTNPYTPAALKAAALPTIGHPPTTSFWFLPLAGLDLRTMSEMVGFTIMALLLAQTYWMSLEFGLPYPLLFATLLLALTLNTLYMQYHLHLAQISGLIGFWLVAAWAALRRERKILAGLALGAALVMKLYPGLILLYLLLHRRWRTVFTAAGVWIAVALLMTSRLGLGSWKAFSEQEHVIVDYWLSNPHNASLAGTLSHAATGGAWVIPGWRPAVPIALAAVIAAVVGIFFLFRRIDAARDPRALELGYWAVAMLAIIGNPFMFEHYSVLTLPPAFRLFGAAWAGDPGLKPRWARPLFATLAAGAIAMTCVDPWLQDRLQPSPPQYFPGLIIGTLRACFWLPPWLLAGGCLALVWARSRLPIEELQASPGLADDRPSGIVT